MAYHCSNGMDSLPRIEHKLIFQIFCIPVEVMTISYSKINDALFVSTASLYDNISDVLKGKKSLWNIPQSQSHVSLPMFLFQPLF